MKKPKFSRHAMIMIGVGLVAMASIPTTRGEANSQPLVTKVTSDSPQPDVAGLGDRLVVGVENLSDLLAQAKKERHEIILYLDGLPLRGVYPESIDLIRNELRFELRRSDAARPTWAALLGKPTHFVRNVSLSVGLEDGHPVDTAVQGRNSFRLVVVHGSWLLACLGLLALIFIWLWVWGRKSQMLRDSGPDPGDGRLRPYSLAKTQMAFWFFLIVSAFVIIWAITGSHDSITESVLVLMGIGSGTALGVAVQDKGKEHSSKVLKELDELRSQRAALAAGTDTTEIDAKIKEKTPASVHFMTDVLTDADGISLHRFQMFVWTLVLGVIFIKEVYCNLAMPEFNATLLALMGISSGTFLGFMISEGHSTEQSKQAND
ncbi:MAG: hypothetical protein ABSG50_10350 [Opitutaceae bacterium]|jgi:hypothetical protein